MKKRLLICFCVAFTALHAQFTIFQENFDLSPNYITNGWISFNMSNPAGSVDWGQGSGSDVGATAYNGSTTSYLVSSFQATTTAGTISDWLISPVINFNNGDTVSFYTLSYNSHYFPDRLECRLSPNGISTDVGSDENSVGDFTMVLVTVNPLLDTTSYPSVLNQGDTWTRYSGVVSGLSGVTPGRIGFRYFVTDAGPGASNSSTVGIDAVVVNSLTAGVENELDAMINIYPNPSADIVNVTVGQPFDGSLAVYDMNGKAIWLQNRVYLNNAIDLSSYPHGNYILKVIKTGTGEFIARSIVKG